MHHTTARACLHQLAMRQRHRNTAAAARNDLCCDESLSHHSWWFSAVAPNLVRFANLFNCSAWSSWRSHSSVASHPHKLCGAELAAVLFAKSTSRTPAQ
jgi:hypothetical protein